MFQVTRSMPRILLAMLVVGGAHAAAAAPPTVNLQQQGTRLLVSGELTVAVSPATAWAVLTDYERVPEFVPGVQISRVTEQSGNTRMLEQQGEMLVNAMRMRYFGTLKVVETPPDKLSIQFLTGTFRNMQGQWNLQGKEAPVKLSYQLDFDTGTPYPSPVMVGMLQQQVIHWVGSLASEMERRPPPKPEAGEKNLGDGNSDSNSKIKSKSRSKPKKAKP